MLKLKAFIVATLLLFNVGCAVDTPSNVDLRAVDTPSNVDLRDCSSTQYLVSELQAYGRPPDTLGIVTVDGIMVPLDMGSISDLTGSITLTTCKKYMKDSTLYLGEHTYVSAMVLVKK